MIVYGWDYSSEEDLTIVVKAKYNSDGSLTILDEFDNRQVIIEGEYEDIIDKRSLPTLED